ncbi:MAG TPA: CHASE3 domain-containing protein [Terriglobia bacterium]|nr:CHASE3 domain-containing protein [Terriglobia bacterium]
MTQRRKIAIVYGLAVPSAVVIVFFIYTSLHSVSGSTNEMAEAAEVIRDSDSVLALLKESEADTQKYIASGGELTSIRAYESSGAELQKTIQDIGEKTKDEQSVQSKFKALGPLVAKQVAIFEKAMAASRVKSAARGKAAPVAESPSLMGDIEEILMEINAVQQVRLQQQNEATAKSINFANSLIIYGGGALVWLVGIAAFLLFHDEQARVWAGVERRVHTNVLQTVPFGVSVATEAGLIVYANPAEEALMGYERGELMGKNADTLHALGGKENEKTVNEILEQLNEDKAWKGDLPVRDKGGATTKISSWVMNLQFPGKVYRLFVHQA